MFKKKGPRASVRKFLAKIFVRPYCEAKKTGKKTCASLLRCKKNAKKSLVRPYCEAFVRPYCQTPLYTKVYRFSIFFLCAIFQFNIE